MRPITVLVPLPPSYRGGTEEYAYRVLERASRAFPIRLVTTRVRWGRDPVPLSTGNAELVVLPGFEMFERPVVISSPARTALRSIVADSSLVHLHMPFPMVERWVTRDARRSSIPIVLTYHMDAELPGPVLGRIATSVYRATSARPALAAADITVSNSRGYAESSPVLAPFLSSVRVIPKGVDPDRLGTAGGESVVPSGLNLPSDEGKDRDRRVLFVGRLVPYKGLPVLLEAVDQLIRKGRSVHLYIAGRGPQEPQLKRWVDQHAIRGRVTFLGFVPDDRLGALYRWADVVACPSINRMESTPTSLEEAASVGTPVLGSDLPGAKESIPSDGVKGVLATPGDVDEVVVGLGRLLDAGHWLPSHVRSWDDVAGDYLRLYASLVPDLASASPSQKTPADVRPGQ
jgi:glycosyltransferase involved in cell wall biosynthesis